MKHLILSIKSKILLLINIHRYRISIYVKLSLRTIRKIRTIQKGIGKFLYSVIIYGQANKKTDIFVSKIRYWIIQYIWIYSTLFTVSKKLFILYSDIRLFNIFEYIQTYSLYSKKVSLRIIQIFRYSIIQYSWIYSNVFTLFKKSILKNFS